MCWVGKIMKKEALERVKTDLRELKKTVHLIDTLIRTRNEYQYRIKQLEASHRQKARAEANALSELVMQIDLEGHINKAKELYSKYMKAIDTLSLIDKSIIVEYYINGLPAWKVGYKIGYSEDGIRKRLSKIIIKIANEI